MDDRWKCRRCDGCGQIADSDDGEPWSMWLDLPLRAAVAVTMGLVRPIPCPNCGGSGGGLTRAHVVQMVDDLRLLAEGGDFEACHGEEDKLRTTVLEAIAGGECTDPAGAAAAALDSDLIDFHRVNA